MRSIAKLSCPSRSSFRRRAALGGLLMASLATACVAEEDELAGEAWEGEHQLDDIDPEDELDDDGVEPIAAVSCDPQMHVFPVAAPHNIGYDHASCGSGTCDVSCPDANANSDWGGDHHGIDVFAHHRADLVAVADGVIERVGEVSNTSGIRVRLRDGCGWEYYYGHLDQATVVPGQTVKAGDRIGYMGATGTASVHLHFNISPNGSYSNDINPFPLLNATSPTACGGGAPPPPPAEPPPPPADQPPPPAGCGTLTADQVLLPGQELRSCDNRFALAMQLDGNLVLYKGNTALWHTYTHGQSASGVVMQADGNLVLYGTSGTALWHTYTHGNPGTVLSLQDDGNLVLYKGSAALWNSGTCCH